MLNFDSTSKAAVAPLEGEMEVALSSGFDREGERCRQRIPIGPFEALLLRPLRR